jgi:hypothetical protein
MLAFNMAAYNIELSLVRSQHFSKQGNLRGSRRSSVEKKSKRPPLSKMKKFIFGKYEENTSQTNNEDISLPFYVLFYYGQKCLC